MTKLRGKKDRPGRIGEGGEGFGKEGQEVACRCQLQGNLNDLKWKKLNLSMPTVRDKA